MKILSFGRKLSQNLWRTLYVYFSLFLYLKVCLCPRWSLNKKGVSQNKHQNMIQIVSEPSYQLQKMKAYVIRLDCT